VDKFVGDEVVAFFVQGFTGAHHAAAAIEAARELLEGTGHDDTEPWIPLGAGIHTGSAFIGSVGQEEALDFTALGDAVNATARLAASAGVGEILVSTAAADAAGLQTADLETQTQELRGRSEGLEAVVLTVRAQGAHMAPR
jgi:adenylate cyclase